MRHRNPIQRLGALLFSAAMFQQVLVAPAETISMNGSDTMLVLAQSWAVDYMKAHPDVQIQITGGGSGTGFAALQNKTTDIANASRPIKPDEQFGCVKAFQALPTEYKVAMDGLYVFVHVESGLEELTKEQLAKLFTGEITNWKEITGIDAPVVLYGRENSSGTYELFKQDVLKGKDFAVSTQSLQGTAQVVQAVAREPFGIGYGGSWDPVGVKPLRIKRDPRSPGVLPSKKTITDRSYPIWRFLYVYVNPNFDRGEIQDFLRWIRSDQGQAIAEKAGYFPIPPELRE